ncbi:DUF2285 domain-containing protein [Gluconacetobacter diazotrophicus]|uniref:DUF2285 domain-containing protein n=1 Tax=Gluconacetobacter diazotrophicus TaxID=33996 RepID=UPI001E4EAC9E|nr:DUF2285 domain-containing protein [Gluconacetobacter diazotrophicus]
MPLLRDPGGCDFPVDPAIPSWTLPGLWAEEVFAAVIAIVPAPLSYQSVVPFRMASFASRLNAETLADGLHLVVDDEHGPLRFWIGEGAERRPAIVIPLDEACMVRLHHVRRFLRRWTGRPGGPLPHALRPTRYRIDRLALALRAVTARKAGATTRMIAGVSDPGVYTMRGALWKDCDQRGTAERQMKLGEHLVAGGYLALLRHGIPRNPETASISA